MFKSVEVEGGGVEAVGQELKCNLVGSNRPRSHCYVINIF